MTSALDDPLRVARRAVQAGEFRVAWDALAGQPSETKVSAEWLLLAAMARWRLGEFLPSRSAALQARDAYRELGDLDGEMRAENVAAAGAFALGDLGEAGRGFSRAHGLAERLHDELMKARCANNLGNVAYYLGGNDDALAYYRIAAVGFERVGLLFGVAETWINTGIVERDLERLEESRESATRALEIAERLGSARLRAQALAMSGEVAGLLGDVRLGRSLLDRALGIARPEEDHLTEIEALRLRTNVERKAGDYVEAARHGEEALTAAERLGHPWALAETARDLGELFVELGDRDRSAPLFDRAALSYENLGATGRAERMRERAAAIRAG